MTKEDEIRLEKEFNRKYAKYIKRIEEENFLRKKKMEIKKLKKENKKALGLTTTKVFSYYLFILFNVILIYALVAMWHFADLSYLGVIITDILGQILVYCIYSIRAFKDTQSEESIKLERDKLEKLPYSSQEKINKIFDMIEGMGLKVFDKEQEDCEFENNEEDIQHSDNEQSDNISDNTQSEETDEISNL